MSARCFKCCGNNEDVSSHRLGDVGEQSPLIVPPERQHFHLPRKDYESLDYDICFNKPFEDYLVAQTKEHSLSKIEIIKWIITFLIGVSTGLVAFFIDTIVKQLSKLKFTTVDHSIQICSEDGCLAVSLLIMVLFNAGFVFIATCLTVYEPVAAGSGIPEIKCYLNGVRIPRVARLKSLIAKAVGVLFSVAGGLFVGKEGPMIHSGAIIGAGIPQFQSITFKKVKSKFDFFRTDRDKRDFVSGGAAAGVAAAFGAPIGGVLFSLEEGCSFWNQKLTWRTFFCSMSATFTLNFFQSGLDYSAWGSFYSPGLINFGVFQCSNEDKTNGTCRLWTAIDLFIFILMGIIGGLLGALFNHLNKYLTIYRMKHVVTNIIGQSKYYMTFKIFESLLVAMVTTTVAFLAAMTLGNCKPIPAVLINMTAPIEDNVRTYFCKEGYYNDMATLFFNSQEEAIKQLFHQQGQFSLRSLGIFFVCFFLLACWTYGTAVPSGLFVPCLLCGAAYGRFVSTLLVNVIGYDRGIYSGTFSLIGAASFLGGVVRMTISLTVILIESTNEISYGLPLMLTLMVAKWSGDFFNDGLYDIHIHLKGVPLLEWDTPSGMHRLLAKNVMSSDIHFIFPRTRVAVLQGILKTTAHNAYPVVSIVNREDIGDISVNNDLTSKTDLDPTHIEQSGRSRILKFEGIILRSQLNVLLKNKVYYQETVKASNQPTISYNKLTEDYPRYPDIVDIRNSDISDTQYIIDVRPYMNPTPYTVYPDTPVPQVFNLFRSMGLRHLPVVDHYGQIQGIITRHNLTHEFLEERQTELNEMEDLNVFDRTRTS
ncbi:H(+)/Cl(-) exchange transporter 6-like [Mercenaria mercenaria]|uniref:H(+)/Cl(-) exchange transporter 6-like n=1 Tax=Mercenaria mercenaria TaxID=6596 RepID=UPI00234EB545|nr:H(+)/Cl(-) exchange transporter 6-like [Mercenaria mercenaria]